MEDSKEALDTASALKELIIKMERHNFQVKQKTIQDQLVWDFMSPKSSKAREMRSICSNQRDFPGWGWGTGLGRILQGTVSFA
jgi:hypothetical protein